MLSCFAGSIRFCDLTVRVLMLVTTTVEVIWAVATAPRAARAVRKEKRMLAKCMEF